MTSSLEYPTFNFNDEKIIIIPGSRFSKMELKSRLKEIGININNIPNKEYLNNVYDSALNDYNNRIKLIQRLKKDTNNMTSKLVLSSRQSMPNNMNISSNIGPNKMTNISYDVNNYYPSSRQQQINILKPIHTNKGKYVQNPFISSMVGQSFNSSYLSNSNNNVINSINNSNNNYNFDKNNISNINKVNNTSSFISDNNSNTNTNNLFNFQPNTPFHDINSNSKVINSINNNINNNQYEEKIYIDENNNKNKNKTPQNSYDDNQLIPEKMENYNTKYNKDAYDNEKNIDKKNITSETNNYIKRSKRLSYQPNELKNELYQKNPNLNNNIINKERKTLTNMPRAKDINEIPYNSAIQRNFNDKELIMDSPEKEDKEEKEDYSNTKNIRKKDYDEISTASFFSMFDNMRKRPFYKNNKFILIHALVLILLICVAYFIFNSFDTIRDFFNSIIEFLSEPKKALELFISYTSHILFIPISYWYISIPSIIIIFVLLYYMRQYSFKKRCGEIIENIVKDLRNNSGNSRGISEEDIYKKYVEKYGISYNKFLRKYLPLLNKMRRKDNRLVLSSLKNDNKEYIFWELS